MSFNKLLKTAKENPDLLSSEEIKNLVQEFAVYEKEVELRDFKLEEKYYSKRAQFRNYVLIGFFGALGLALGITAIVYAGIGSSAKSDNIELTEQINKIKVTTENVCIRDIQYMEEVLDSMYTLCNKEKPICSRGRVDLP